MKKNNYQSRGESLIGIIIILVVVGLFAGGLYYYLSKQIPEIPEVTEKPAEEEIIKPEEEITPPPEEVTPPKEEVVTPLCQNECSPSGLKRCSDNGYQICGNYDADACLEWSSVTNCPANTICQNGICTQQKCADGTKNNECSFFNKPKFCENGNLIDSCSKCGCQPGRICRNNKCIGRVWNLIASNDPADYLGDYIYEEVYSNWKQYQPMVNKVNELINSLTDNNDKAKAIANWIKSSKIYNESALVANTYEATIIDIFNSHEGMCLDASMLTTAMLRLANIPARTVLSATGVWHAYTEAYLNQEWIGIDATFGSGEAGFFPNLTAVLYTGRQIPSNNLFVKSKKLSSDAEERHIVDIGGGEYNVEKATYFEQKVIPRSNYSYIYYPIATELIPCKLQDEPPWLCYDHVLEFDDMHKAADFLQYIFISKDKQCSYYYCEQVSNSQNLAMSVPTNHYKGYYIEHPLQKISEAVACNEPCWNRAFLKKFGYIKTALPPGKYTIKYWGSNSGGPEKPVAYYDFEVRSGETIIIKPDALKKFPDSDSNKFNVFIELLKRSVEGIVIE